MEAFHEEEYSKRVDLGLWRRLMAYARPYRGNLLIVLITTVVGAVSDNALPLVTRQLIDRAAAHAHDPTVPFSALLFGATYVVIMLINGLAVWGIIYYCGRISTGLSHDVRQAGFVRLQELSFSYYDRRPVGWLVSRLTSDCDRLARVIAWGCLDVLFSFWTLVFVSSAMLWINWRLALIVMAVVPPMVWVSLFFKKRLLEASRAMRKTNSRITAAFNEGIGGVRTTKSLVREDENFGEFRSISAEMYQHSVRNALLGALYLPAIITLGGLSLAAVLWRGGVLAMAGDISPGTVIMFLSFAASFVWPIAEMARVLSDMQAAQAAAERVLDLLNTEPEIKDSPEVVADNKNAGWRGPAKTGHEEPDHIGQIEFRGVKFAYQQGEAVLDDFSLTVRAGETLALVGPTGGGKSTIVSLLCRFYEPTGGEILLDGVDYRRRSLHWLQSKLGIVLQAPHLFKGTVRENIRYGKLEADDAEVERVARLVNAHEFITGLALGYDTDVGEGGNHLSVGQKQLVALARAVLAEPQIFVMDEATSSVDTRTEQLIQRGVEKVLKSRTSFVIAHRLSTIRSADRILVIDDGRIVEEGTHHDLIRRRGRYYELYTNQFTQEKEEEVLRAALNGDPGATL